MYNYANAYDLGCTYMDMLVLLPVLFLQVLASV